MSANNCYDLTNYPRIRSLARNLNSTFAARFGRKLGNDIQIAKVDKFDEPLFETLLNQESRMIHMEGIIEFLTQALYPLVKVEAANGSTQHRDGLLVCTVRLFNSIYSAWSGSFKRMKEIENFLHSIVLRVESFEINDKFADEDFNDIFDSEDEEDEEEMSSSDCEDMDLQYDFEAPGQVELHHLGQISSIYNNLALIYSQVDLNEVLTIDKDIHDANGNVIGRIVKILGEETNRMYLMKFDEVYDDHATMIKQPVYFLAHTESCPEEILYSDEDFEM
ncbi:MAG: hypothetical protein MHMPM18_002615 [Marteilia pararefringens]